MGLLIVIVVGATLGWLASIIVQRDDRVGTSLCGLSGITGSVVAAVSAGDVPLNFGVSTSQLLWGVLGAILAIVAVNAALVKRLKAEPGNV